MFFDLGKITRPGNRSFRSNKTDGNVLSAEGRSGSVYFGSKSVKRVRILCISSSDLPLLLGHVCFIFKIIWGRGVKI